MSDRRRRLRVASADAVFFPDGKRLLVSATGAGQEARPLRPGHPGRKAARRSPGRRTASSANAVSPDGIWVAAYGDWTEDVFLLPTSTAASRARFPDTQGRRPRSAGAPDGQVPLRRRDGKHSRARRPRSTSRPAAASPGRSSRRRSSPASSSIAPVLMTPDGKCVRLRLLRESRRSSDLYLVERSRRSDARDRLEARPLRDPRPDRRRGDGRGLPGEGPAARPRGRDQGAAARRSRRTRTGCAASSRRRRPPASSTTPTSRPSTTSATHDGAPYVVQELLEGETLRAALAGGQASAAPGDRLRPADRARPRRRARQGHRPPGPEAREPLRHERRPRQDPRLRPRQADAGQRGLGPADQPADRDRGHRARHGHGHDRLHVARAGQGQARRRALGHLLLRRDPLRDALGQARVPRRLGRRDDGRDPQGGAAGSLRHEPERSRPASSASSATASRRTPSSGSTRRTTSRSTSRRCRAPPARRSRRRRGSGCASRRCCCSWRASSPGAAAAYLALRGGRAAAPAAGPGPTFRRLTNLSGAENSPTLSPDGQTLAFVHRSGGPVHVWAQRVTRPQADRPDAGLRSHELLSGLLARRKPHRLRLAVRRRRPLHHGGERRERPPRGVLRSRPRLVAGRARDRLLDRGRRQPLRPRGHERALARRARRRGAAEDLRARTPSSRASRRTDCASRSGRCRPAEASATSGRFRTRGSRPARSPCR